MELEFKHLIDALPGMVWVALPDGRAEFLSQRWRDYTGLTHDQAVGFGWHSVVHPDDVDQLLEKWRLMLESERAGELTARMRRQDGRYRRFLFSASPIADQSGRPVRWCGTNTDIEEWLTAEEALRASERLQTSEAQLREAYRYLAEAQHLSRTGSFTADIVADEHTWSEELYRIFEFDPSVRISVQDVRAVLHPDDLLSFDSEFERSATEGTDFDQYFRIVTPGGKVKHLHSVGHFMERVEGRPVFIGAIQDVTQSTVAEEALARARTEIAHMSRVSTLGALTASIAHEVNQPLSGITINAGTCVRRLAADPPNLEGALEAAERTLRDAKRMSEVIQRLRSLFSRNQPTNEPVDLSDAAREVLALSSSELQGGAVILRTELPDELPAAAGDRVQLQQVILNLILNAIDAMKTIDDRPRHLLVTTASDEPGWLRLSVADSGVGIDSERSEELFNAFYTTKSHGMGLGLSVSRSIIESHGGWLSATANEGPGATFSFSIPCRLETSPEIRTDTKVSAQWRAQ